MQANIEILRDNAANLRESDQTFAASLLRQHARKGRLSDRQMPYVDKLAGYAVNGYPAAKTASVGDFAGVLALLAKAKTYLKWPKIRLQDASGHPVVLSVAGPRSKYMGQINVTDGGPYGANRWYGRIDNRGTWTQPRHTTGLDGVEVVLKSLADDPAGTAAAHGKLTGSCCFCNRGLEDDKSTSAGYGPVCAKNYGLPWGGKS